MSDIWWRCSRVLRSSDIVEKAAKVVFAPERRKCGSGGKNPRHPERTGGFAENRRRTSNSRWGEGGGWRKMTKECRSAKPEGRSGANSSFGFLSSVHIRHFRSPPPPPTNSSRSFDSVPDRLRPPGTPLRMTSFPPTQSRATPHRPSFPSGKLSRCEAAPRLPKRMPSRHPWRSASARLSCGGPCGL
jgi:hypothetical protein